MNFLIWGFSRYSFTMVHPQDLTTSSLQLRLVENCAQYRRSHSNHLHTPDRNSVRRYFGSSLLHPLLFPRLIKGPLVKEDAAHISHSSSTIPTVKIFRSYNPVTNISLSQP